jgi:hypothetical protein
MPQNFTTFATPHLGVRSPLVGTPSFLFNALGSRILSYSGQQLFMIDSHRDTGRPLLSVMADPSTSFMKGLAHFQKRSLYSNVINDRSAVFYTTFISRTDPFADLKDGKVKVNYAPGYEDTGIIVDRTNPVSPGVAPAFTDRLLGHTRWLPIYGILSVVIPVAATGFLISCGIQSFRSYGRMKEYQAGRAIFGPEVYRLPLPPSIEAMYAKAGAVTGTGEGHLLDDAYASGDATPNTDDAKSNAERPRSSGFVEASPQKKDAMEAFPTLALTPEQFEMIDQLNQLGWEKVPVHIQKVRHSHAAIIVRMNTRIRDFGEGKVVVKHWVDRFKI